PEIAEVGAARNEQQVTVGAFRRAIEPRLLPQHAHGERAVEHRLVDGLEPWPRRQARHYLAASPDDDAVHAVLFRTGGGEELADMSEASSTAEVGSIDADSHGRKLTVEADHQTTT